MYYRLYGNVFRSLPLPQSAPHERPSRQGRPQGAGSQSGSDMKLEEISESPTGAAGGHRKRNVPQARSPAQGCCWSGDRARTSAHLPTPWSSAFPPVGRQGPGGRNARAAEARGRVDVLAVDLRLAQARKAVRDAARARQANVLVNCAGIASFGPLESLGR